jgi:hypothetical protein
MAPQFMHPGLESHPKQYCQYPLSIAKRPFVLKLKTFFSLLEAQLIKFISDVIYHDWPPVNDGNHKLVS